MWKKIIIILFSLFYSNIPRENEIIWRIYPLKHASIDATNLASLQRGAKYFMNFCSGCHSLRFMSYNRLAADLKITDKTNLGINNQRLKNNLIFTEA
ncbi:MAG: cytochrome c1, partial [Rickettsiella sp.]|nr:cytochrome c1 [Rickettsiella sp.]